jgi:hypothetical protein
MLRRRLIPDGKHDGERLKPRLALSICSEAGLRTSYPDTQVLSQMQAGFIVSQTIALMAASVQPLRHYF